MPIILVLIAVIGLGVFWGYPKYQIMQLEDEARTNLKSGGFAQFKANYQPLMQAAKVDFDVLDQYPNIRFYMRNTLYEGSTLPAPVQVQMQSMPCASIETFKVLEAKARTAMLNVLEEDQITFHIHLKNKLGAELMHHEQKLSQCPNFMTLRQL